MTSSETPFPWIIKIPAEHQLHHVRRLFEKEIVGVSAKRAEHTESVTRRAAYDYVPKDHDGQAFPAIWRGAYDASNHLVGALYMHTPYEQLIEVGRVLGPEFTEGMGTVRRTLASIAVVPGMRRSGLGSALLEAGESQAKQEGAMWVTGFMDERNGTPDFYAKHGYTIHARNVALPKLDPFGVGERHPSYVNGQWFYKQI